VRESSRVLGLATAAIRDDGDHWKIIVQVFGDTKSSPETLRFTVDFGGDYELGANSNTVPAPRDALQLYPQADYADGGWRRFPEATVRPISLAAGYSARHHQARLRQAFYTDRDVPSRLRPDRDSGQHAATRQIATLPARSEVPLRPIRLANWSRRQEAEDAEVRRYVNREAHGSK
jgi:hypothetical protein